MIWSTHILSQQQWPSVVAVFLRLCNLQLLARGNSKLTVADEKRFALGALGESVRRVVEYRRHRETVADVFVESGHVQVGLGHKRFAAHKLVDPLTKREREGENVSKEKEE